MKSTTVIYKRHRFPPEIIQYAVWLYHRFNLSHRDVEDLMSNGASLSAMKPFACGVISLALNLPVGYDENTKGMVTPSSLMRCSLRFRVGSITYGEQ